MPQLSGALKLPEPLDRASPVEDPAPHAHGPPETEVKEIEPTGAQVGDGDDGHQLLSDFSGADKRERGQPFPPPQPQKASAEEMLSDEASASEAVRGPELSRTSGPEFRQVLVPP